MVKDDSKKTTKVDLSDNINLKERCFKVQVDGEEKDYKIIRPTFYQGNKADLIYKKHFGDALRAGLLTAIQMKEEVDVHEYYSSSSEKMTEIDNEIESSLETLKDYEKKDEDVAAPVVYRIKELRANKMIETYKINALYENTAESYAENIRNQFYASELTRKTDGDRVWKNFEVFQKDVTNPVAQSAVTNVMLFNARISDNFQMEYGENQWLLQNGFINEKGEYIDQKKEIEEEEKEVKQIDTKEPTLKESDVKKITVKKTPLKKTPPKKTNKKGNKSKEELVS